MNKQIVIPVIAVLTIGIIVMGYFLGQQTNRLGKAEAEIVALEGNIVALQINLTESKATVSTLETKLTAADTKIVALEGNIVALQTKLAEAEPDPIQDPGVEPELLPVIWKAELPLYVIEGQTSIGARGLWEEFNQLWPHRVGLLGGHPLVTGVERHLEWIRASNTIFLISPDELEALTELAKKYPELLPLSYDELKLYSPPFMYAARDEETEMIRVLIIAHRLPNNLVKFLAKFLMAGMPLETPIPIQDLVAEPELELMWKAQLPLYVIGGQVFVKGILDLHTELDRLFGRVSLLGGHPLVTGVEEYLEWIRKSNTIFLISPDELEALTELARKYPELLPLSYDELKLYSPPFMYVARDQETGMIRVLVIAHQVPDSLAKLLIEGVSLETPIPLEGNVVALQKKLPEPEPDPIRKPIFDAEGPREGVSVGINILEFFAALQRERYEVAERYLTPEFAVKIKAAGGLEKIWAAKIQGRALIGHGSWGGLEVPEEHRVENIEQTASLIEMRFGDKTRKEFLSVSRLVEGVWLIEYIKNWGK